MWRKKKILLSINRKNKKIVSQDSMYFVWHTSKQKNTFIQMFMEMQAKLKLLAETKNHFGKITQIIWKK